MIVSFRDKATEALYRGQNVAKLQGIRRQAEKRLRILEAAVSLASLAALPSNRLETLRGDRNGQYSIRINRQWRICFRWLPADFGPSDVEIVDYH